MKMYREIKIYRTEQNANSDDFLTILGVSKDEIGHSFTLRGSSRVLLFKNRLGVGSCVNIETNDDGVEISRMSRAIDTIESFD